eukprot:1154307-Pelagomonas_calceolata.AAC.3
MRHETLCCGMSCATKCRERVRICTGWTHACKLPAIADQRCQVCVVKLGLVFWGSTDPKQTR